MTAHVTRAGAGTPFTPGADHSGVTPVRLHGGEAGPTDRLVVGRSTYAPGAGVEAGPVPAETVYMVLDGALDLVIDAQPVSLSVGDSVHLPAGSVRSISVGTRPATMLVVRAS